MSTSRKQMALLKRKVNVRAPVVSTAQVRQMINANIEHKIYSDTTTGTLAVGGLVSPIFMPADADDWTARTGLVVRPTHITSRVSLVSGTTSSIARVILFQDRHARGAAPAVTDVLLTAAYNSNYLSVNLLNNRFKIIFDETVALGSSTLPPTATFKRHEIPLRGTVSFMDGSGTSTGLGENAIFMLIIGSNVSGTYDLKNMTKFTDA